mgnify:CR=1 FL=1
MRPLPKQPGTTPRWTAPSFFDETSSGALLGRLSADTFALQKLAATEPAAKPAEPPAAPPTVLNATKVPRRLQAAATRPLMALWRSKPGRPSPFVPVPAPAWDPTMSQYKSRSWQIALPALLVGLRFSRKLWVAAQDRVGRPQYMTPPSGRPTSSPTGASSPLKPC